jgi:UDP-hydrolysing UDP-N-acetyl-D-glucosamine 2-epimerase
LIAVVVTARPSYSRIKSVLTALKDAGAAFVIIPAASAGLKQYGNVAQQIQQDFPGHVGPTVYSVVDSGEENTTGMSTGLLTVQLSHVFRSLEPRTVVTIADRHETLATAIAASYLNIELCHIQGGEVSGSIDDRVRDAVTQLADTHCVSTRRASERVRLMRGPAGVHITGCPSIDVAARALKGSVKQGTRFVVLQHPNAREPEAAPAEMEATIIALQEFGADVTWLSPGNDAGSLSMRRVLEDRGLDIHPGFPPEEFLRFLLGSGVLVGNSSVGIRECSFLGIGAVNIGSRQQSRERGANVTDVPHDPEVIRSEALRLANQRFWRTTLYGDGRAGERIAQVLLDGKSEAVA